MARRSTPEFEQAICDALGLRAERVKRIDITMVPGDVTVKVTELLWDDDMLKEFERVFRLATWNEGGS